MSKKVRRLYEHFQPEHYNLHLAPNKTAMTFSGTVVVEGRKVGRPSQRLTFHQKALKITSATITFKDKKSERAIAVSRINNHAGYDEVRLHTDQMIYSGSYVVTLEFEGKITPGMTGLYPCFFNHEGREHTLLATQFESHHARELFPCIDEPEAKATFDMSLVTEPGLTVLGNTPIKTTSNNADGSVTTRFETSPRMSSYLLAFVIGELHSKSAKTKNGTEVSVWGTIAQPIESFDFALDIAVRSIEFFEDYFQVPYPLPKADHVALPDFASGAMENWGLITYREVALLLYPNEASQSAKEMIATIIAHETSHQWFGNLVTMSWWDDLWLNESFANMMEYLAVDSMHPEWQMWDTFVSAEGLSALRRDANAGVQAVRTAVNHPDEISTLFDPSIVYAKGGRLLYMLKNYIGDETFRKGLQAYFTKFAYKNTEGSDLWLALTKSSGKNVAGFMNPWLERSGFPVIAVDQNGTDVTISQQQFLNNPDKADKDRLWPVPLFANNSDITDLLEAKSTTQDLTETLPILINQEARGHYIVHYQNTAHKKAIVAMVGQNKLSAVDRLMLLNSSAMLARAGYESLADTLELMGAYSEENTETVWDIMSLVIGDARRFVDIDESLELSLKKFVGMLIIKQLKRLGWDESEDDSPADQKLRATILGLASYAELPEVIDQALTLFKEYQMTQKAIPAELRGIVFGIAVKQKVPGAINYLLDLHAKTHNGDLKRDIAGAVTSARAPEEIQQILDLLQDTKKIKTQDADRWLFSLLGNRYSRQLAWDWMIDHWDWIKTTYQDDKSYDYFPRYAAAICNTSEWQKKYVEFFTPKIDEIVLKRNITIGLDEIADRVAWIERDAPKIVKFLKSVK